MALQGPILIVADRSAGALAQACTGAGAYPVIEASWAAAHVGLTEIRPAAIVIDDPDIGDGDMAAALARQAAGAAPFVPLLIRVREDQPSALPDALAVDEHAPVETLIARLTGALRLRALHATMLGRAQTLKAERDIVAEPPAGDPLDDATVLLVGRGRHHATLSVAVGERMGVMGALSIDAAARCLVARDIDGIVIGDGLPNGSVAVFLETLSEDSRFRDLPIAVLGPGGHEPPLPNLVWSRDPLLLLQRAVPLVRLRAFEAMLRRLLQSIECKGMIDPRTGLFNAEAFGHALDHAIGDCAARGVALSLARFTFEHDIDRRTSLDAARLVGRLVRDTDFACREDDGSILFAFADTDLRSAHVVARRLAAVLKHTMLRQDRERPSVSPSVTLATLKPSDTTLSLIQRVTPRPVAAA